MDKPWARNEGLGHWEPDRVPHHWDPQGRGRELGRRGQPPLLGCRRGKAQAEADPAVGQLGAEMTRGIFFTGKTNN